MKNLKWLLPRLPLPMLALAASYGVYQFALLFVPWWVALVQAAAFETTYLGLAMIESETVEQRRRATAISVGAVVVSVLYNSLAGFLHRNGLGEVPMWGEIVLATLHGAPLAIVAYLVADLLLHKSESQQVDSIEVAMLPELIAQPAPISLPTPQPDIKFSPAPSEEVALQPVSATSVLPNWLTGDEVAAEEEPASSTLSLSKRVTAILNNRPSLSDAELYELLPGCNQKSVRVYSSAWRKSNLATSQNGNGRH
jgi:hypothetical protein